jgi:predicted transposase/invertase (TIGR01784 family)
MQLNMSKFINPCTDWGFKHIFGEKEFLINFLNSLFEGEHVITDIRYLNNERLPEQIGMRKVIYDIFCKTESGEHIIVEMQNRWQEHFQDRALFYMSKSIVSQGLKSAEWDYQLTAVYGIFFTNFLLDREPSEHFCKDVMLIDKHTGKVFNRKFRQIYIELPRFLKQKDDCGNFFEYWIYNLINMNKMNEISFKDKQEIFSRLERVASQANLSEEERARYEEEWKIYNDYFNTIESAKKQGAEEGMEKGRAEGKAEGLDEGEAKGEYKANIENAKKMKTMEFPIETISQITGLSPEEIEKL